MNEYGRKLNFYERGMATCNESNQEYQLSNGIVNRIS